MNAALEHAAGTGLPMLELRVLDSAVNLAIARQDKDALLRHARPRYIVRFRPSNRLRKEMTLVKAACRQSHDILVCVTSIGATDRPHGVGV